MRKLQLHSRKVCTSLSRKISKGFDYAQVKLRTGHCEQVMLDEAVGCPNQSSTGQVGWELLAKISAVWVGQ